MEHPVQLCPPNIRRMWSCWRLHFLGIVLKFPTPEPGVNWRELRQGFGVPSAPKMFPCGIHGLCPSVSPWLSVGGESLLGKGLGFFGVPFNKDKLF